MASKLTLSVNPAVVERAKEYAQENGVSVSKLVEDYLVKITSVKPNRKSRALSDLMKIRGILGPVSVDFDYKKEVAGYLSKKHGNR